MVKVLRNRYDSFYDSTLEKANFTERVLSDWPRDRVEAVMHFSGRGGTVLDVGCGDGYLLWQLRNHYSELIGLEYSGQRLKQAEVNLRGCKFKPIHASAESMEAIESDSVDCVVSADTIEHIPDVYRAVDEIFRVLKPGGQLVINTPNIAFIKKRLLLLFGRFPSTSQRNEGLGSDILFDGGHLHYFTYRSLALLLMKAGFRIERKIGYGKFGKLHCIYAPLLSGGVQLIARKPANERARLPD